jgi:hypothetical protein
MVASDTGVARRINKVVSIREIGRNNRMRLGLAPDLTSPNPCFY